MDICWNPEYVEYEMVHTLGQTLLRFTASAQGLQSSFNSGAQLLAENFQGPPSKPRYYGSHKCAQADEGRTPRPLMHKSLP